MIKIQTTPSRRPPTTIAGIEPTPDEIARYNRKVQDEHSRNLNELKKAVNMDDRDEVVVVSAGDEEEVAVTHDLGVVPQRWKLVDKQGRGDIWRSTINQWNENTVYFQTSADEGVEFVVVLGRKPGRRDS